MLSYPNINPIAFHIGTWPVYWYGLMYLFGFLLCWVMLTWRIRTSPRGFSSEQLSDILFYGALGAIIGGRLGYMLFYDWYDVIHHPVRIFMTWKGGMSFHGGALGVFIAMWVYSRKSHLALGDIGDFIAPVVPLGLGLGRIGNFINGELTGRVTDVPWAMVFPNAGNLPRHPSQLYEFLLEGVVLFVVLWIYSSKPKPRWAVIGLFLTLYALFRFCVEFFREPDQQIGFIAGWLTEGQLLSVPMFLIGILVMMYAYKRKALCDNI